jgi:mannose-1-phosphate guanylyltransferase
VILAGGVGARFWPVSTPERPKQLLPLAGDRPLLAQTVARIRPLVPLERIRILAGQGLRAPILDALPELTPENLWLEPRARGTAPVLAWAATEIARQDPDAVMYSLHADHVIRPEDDFRALVARVGALSARARRLCTLGVVPTRPETGYGYILEGEPLADEPDLQAFAAARFVEKPDRATAGEYLRTGGYLWNTGIFIWPARLLLEELRAHTPEIAQLLPLLERGQVTEFFERAPTLSVDEGVLERSTRVAVARARFDWDDVGAWDAVARTRSADTAGNVAVGDAHLVDARDCIAWADDGSVVVYGADGLVVVRAHGITLVAPRERAPDLKKLLAQLPERLREPGTHG